MHIYNINILVYKKAWSKNSFKEIFEFYITKYIACFQSNVQLIHEVKYLVLKILLLFLCRYFVQYITRKKVNFGFTKIVSSKYLLFYTLISLLENEIRNSHKR